MLYSSIVKEDIYKYFTTTHPLHKEIQQPLFLLSLSLSLSLTIIVPMKVKAHSGELNPIIETP